MLAATLQPLTGPSAAEGIARVNAARLALADMNTYHYALPAATVGGAPRDLAIVSCDQYASGQGMKGALDHLLQDLGVQVVLGPQSSNAALEAKGPLLAHGALMLNPSATTRQLTEGSGGLVWRTATSNVYETAGIALLVHQIEVAARKQNMGAWEFKAAAVSKQQDPYGTDLVTGTVDKLMLNGKRVATLADPSGVYRSEAFPADDLAVKQSAAQATLQRLLDFAPHVILLFGVAELVPVLQKIEERWPAATARPFYVIPEGLKTQALKDAVRQNPSLASRMRVFAPQVNAALYTQFQSDWNMQYQNTPTSMPPDVYGTTGMYDAVYLLTYALAATASRPVTGAAVAAGLRRLSQPDAQVITAGGPSLATGTAELVGGGNINYDGVTGKLDFDPTTGDAPNNYDINCVQIKNEGVQYVPSGQSYYPGPPGDPSINPDTLMPCP